MRYVVRKGFTLLGEVLKPGDRVDGADVPVATLAKLVEQHRVAPDQDADTATAPKHRGRSSKAAA